MHKPRASARRAALGRRGDNPFNPFTLDLRFAQNKTLPGGPSMTFTRASSGTYFDSSGVLQTATTNVARFGHVYDSTLGIWVSKGVLLEGSRQNVVFQSEDFGTTWSTGTGASVTTNQAVAPDGNTTADQLNDTSSGDFGIISSNSITVANDSTAYVASVFIKKTTAAATFPCINLKCTGGTLADGGVVVNTDAGTLTDRSGVVPDDKGVIDCGDYWRVWVRNDNNSTGNTHLQLEIFPAINTNASGTLSATTTGSIIAWGAQIEVGTFPSSYNKTTTAAVTRAADVLTLPTSSIPGFNESQGTFFAEFYCPAIPSSWLSILMDINDGTANNAHNFEFVNSNQLSYRTFVSGSQKAGMSSASAITAATSIKVVGAYSDQDFSWVVAGATPVTDSTASALPSGLTTWNLNGYATGSNEPGYKFLSRIAYSPRRLPNGYLQRITT